MHLSTRRKLTGGAVILPMLALCLEGCGSRVVYLGNSTTRTVQLRETVRNVKVWVKDSTGTAVPGVADLLEGGYYRNDLTLERPGATEAKARARLPSSLQ
ncbi:MAG: hypothetical protein HKK67_13735 [Chlorobiaceae bacterium]|nr:hypothetical protein [Chlorobiaceae bacterium]